MGAIVGTARSYSLLLYCADQTGIKLRSLPTGRGQPFVKSET